MTENRRRIRLAILLFRLTGCRMHDQELNTRANYGALVGFLDGLDEADFRFFAARLLTDPTPSREEATRRMVMRPHLQAAVEQLVHELNPQPLRRAGRGA